MRFRPIGLLVSGLVVASSGCSMDATAPTPLAPSAAAARAADMVDGGWNERANGRPFAGALEATTYVITVDPQRQNVLRFGSYTLDLPANAICDQDSGYGLDLFDMDCKAEKDSVAITALVRSTADGIPRIDLLPEKRFNPKRVVTLTVAVPAGPLPTSPRFLYCATISTAVCVDEAQLDPSLATYVDEANRTVFRRIKHFSGYWVLE